MVSLEVSTFTSVMALSLKVIVTVTALVPVMPTTASAADTILEKGTLTKLVERKQLMGYVHRGYWQCMDTLREKQQLEQLWESGRAPWKQWEE